MNWDEIIGQDDLKHQLIQSIEDHRIGHAMLFTGDEGYGVLPLVLAFCKEIFEKEHPSSGVRVSNLTHMDLHFSFPVFSQDGKSVSSAYRQDFSALVKKNPYFSFEDWTQELDSEKKQFQISVQEMDAITEKMTLKSYEGGHKILIVWRADKMNTEAANKFLKLLEEPPKNTIIILTAENAASILPTILSRTQIYEVPRIAENDIRTALLKHKEILDEDRDVYIHQAQGNWNTVLKLLEYGSVDEEFGFYFVKWVRDAFMVKKKPQYLKEIIGWAADIAGWSREKQKKFLEYCSEMFRLALMQNYEAGALVYKTVGEKGFNWEKFSEYIHGSNIVSILEEISEANLQLIRNGNSRLIWTDMGIKLSRYIHKKP